MKTKKPHNPYRILYSFYVDLKPKVIAFITIIKDRTGILRKLLAYMTTQNIINDIMQLFKQKFTLIFVGLSFVLGGVYIFLLGYKTALHSIHSSTKPESRENLVPNKLDPASPISPYDNVESTPLLPMPDMSYSPISGSFTYQNAISIAKMYLRNEDFERARVWIYRAYSMDNSKEVWDLYLRSFELDSRISQDSRTKVLELYERARRYYGF